MHPEPNIGHLIQDFTTVLLAGCLAGVICSQVRVSLLVGYLVIGAALGPGGLHIVSEATHDLELVAEAGALLLLFSVGIEFSLDELVRFKRHFLQGGALQMTGVAGPLCGVAWLSGCSLAESCLIATAGAFSSTVLVFRSLVEAGQAESPHGRAGIAVLLFQDAALAPLMLLLPVLLGGGEAPSLAGYTLLAFKGLGFLAGVLALQQLFTKFGVSILVHVRSVELLVLLTLAILCGLCVTAFRLGLPTPVGAFAAGIVLSGTRLSKQIDTIILPFRETFAAVFFVTIGMLLRPTLVVQEPWTCLAILLLVLTVKTTAAAVALRAVGVDWRAAWGMGLGLSQLGEFSFLLAARGVSAGVLPTDHYNQLLCVGIITLVLTPWLLRIGLTWAGQSSQSHTPVVDPAPELQRALVIGIGPVGGHLAAQLETRGFDVQLVDLSPVNLHPFAQMGFATLVGDARDMSLLTRTDIDTMTVVIVCVPQDEVAVEIVQALRTTRPRLAIVVRCRYQYSQPLLLRAGATAVVSEEQEVGTPLLQAILAQSAGGIVR